MAASVRPASSTSTPPPSLRSETPALAPNRALFRSAGSNPPFSTRWSGSWPEGGGLIVCSLTLLAFFSPSCGGGNDEREAAIVATFATRLGEVEGSPLAASPDAANCASHAAVEAIGGDRFEQLGIGPEASEPLDQVPFSDTDLVAVAEAVSSCIESDAVMAGVLADLDRYPSAVVDCLIRTLPAAFQRRTEGAVLTGLDPIAYEAFFENLVPAEAACPDS